MIEGDNLEVLKLLQKSYASKVKAHLHRSSIQHRQETSYTRDNYRDNIQELPRVDRPGRRRKPEADRRILRPQGDFTLTWLNMMYPRLKLARSTSLARHGWSDLYFD